MRPSYSESDVNASPRRRAWQAENVSASAGAILERDARAFLHQAVSTPCLSVVRKAEGIWLQDVDGRR
jgi:4-aminobutyrate aminotransferase